MEPQSQPVKVPAKIKPMDELKMSIKRMEGQFAAALPKHIPVERFVRVAQTAIAANPKLLNADRNSLYSACMACAQQGLLPDAKESALVMFGDQVVFMPMIAGILKKIRNSGELATIFSEIIYKNDYFKYWNDSDGQHMEHTPLIFGERGNRIGAYALAKTKDGAIYIEVMTMDQINAVKNVSRSKDGIWSGPFQDEMIKKTLMRRLSKRLPSSTDLDGLFEADNKLYDLDPQAGQEDVTSGTTAETPKKKSRLKNLMGHAQEQTEAPPPQSNNEPIDVPSQNMSSEEIPI